VFFGRERLVAEMVARLPGARCWASSGRPGRKCRRCAPLSAAIGAGVLPGSEAWARAVIRPASTRRPGTPRAGPAGRRPVRGALHGLPRRARARGVRRSLLDRARRDTIVSSPCGPTSTGVPAYPELAALGANHAVGMQRHELRRAVKLPARQAGVRSSPAHRRPVADVEHEPGALPLLSTALFEPGTRVDAGRVRAHGRRAGPWRAQPRPRRAAGDDGRARRVASSCGSPATARCAARPGGGWATARSCPP
jgi:hypothetical protein